MSLKHPRVSRQRGFTLMEMLVAVLLFGIGLLGVVGLNAVSLASSYVAGTRTVANELTTDMADRMRANRDAAYAAAGSRYSDLAPVDNSCRAMYISRLNVAPAVCTTTQMAEDDLKDWADQVARILPGGVGVVCMDSTPVDGVSGAAACDGVGNVYAIKVFWNERGARGEDVRNMRFSSAVQP